MRKMRKSYCEKGYLWHNLAAMLRAQLHSFDISHHFQVLWLMFCFAKPLTTQCSAAILRLKCVKL